MVGVHGSVVQRVEDENNASCRAGQLPGRWVFHLLASNEVVDIKIAPYFLEHLWGKLIHRRCVKA